MSAIRVNNITNRSGSAGPTIAGTATVNSTSHFVVPTGRTGQRYVDDGENIVRDGLVLYLDAKYSYPGASGSNPDVYTWYDMSGNENHGELKNGVSYSGTNGGSLVFDDVNDYILSYGKVSFLKNQDKTVSVWINPSAINIEGLYNRRVVGFYNNENLAIEQNSIGWYSSGSTSFALVGISSNTWINATYVFSSTESPPGTHKMYVNGSLGISSTVVQLGALQSAGAINDSPIRISGYYADGNGRFVGRIAQVSIYNRALSASEVLQNYNATKSRFQ
jgi:hypothetical protein